MNPEHVRELSISAAVITVSSTRVKENDTSGKTIQDILGKGQITVSFYSIVPDDIERIRSEVFLAMQSANCVILNGGTGITHDDCTIEAVAPLLEKTIDGFGEFFRMKSLAEIGTSALLSRALAGIFNKKVIFCIPGSTPAVKLATEQLILPELAHILTHANK